MIKINEQEINTRHFPDRTLLLKAEPDWEAEPVKVSWYFENNEELVVLIFIVQHLRALGTSGIELDLPYLPNARQDRVKGKEDVFTLKYFAEVINWLGFQKVRVLDPHSYVSEALIDRIEVLYPDRYIEKIAARLPEAIFFYPDEGAAKRYSSRYDVAYTFGIKTRDWQTGHITGLDISGGPELVRGKDVLIVDDICSRGGTFYHAASKLKQLNAANIYLFITHCENTILEGELLKSGLVEKIYTTNSIFTLQHETIEVIDIRTGKET